MTAWGLNRIDFHSDCAGIRSKTEPKTFVVLNIASHTAAHADKFKPVFWPQSETDQVGTEGSRVYA